MKSCLITTLFCRCTRTDSVQFFSLGIQKRRSWDRAEDNPILLFHEPTLNSKMHKRKLQSRVNSNRTKIGVNWQLYPAICKFAKNSTLSQEWASAPSRHGTGIENVNHKNSRFVPLFVTKAPLQSHENSWSSFDLKRREGWSKPHQSIFRTKRENYFNSAFILSTKWSWSLWRSLLLDLLQFSDAQQHFLQSIDSSRFGEEKEDPLGLQFWFWQHHQKGRKSCE